MQSNLNAGEDRNAIQIAMAYHERSKHHHHRYANGPGGLDWANQPNPFRRYEGAPLWPLCLPDEPRDPSYGRLFAAGPIPPQPVHADSISRLLYFSMALSAWKQIGPNRWALRVNPSSGNLHPTETYLVTPALDGFSDLPAVYHYSVFDHGLEQRATFSNTTWNDLIQGLPTDVFFIGLTSIYWRESWKYGERAYRYCQHDAGHALAALRIAAMLLGWRLVFLNNVPDQQVVHLLGLNRANELHSLDQESPDMLLAVLPLSPADPSIKDHSLSAQAVEEVGQCSWSGTPNRLSTGHQPWAVIEEVSRSCGKPPGARLPVSHPGGDKAHPSFPSDADGNFPAARILRQRRSAVAMDGKTRLARDSFYTILSRAVPRSCRMPWDAISWSGFVHLGIFVHRVDGLPSGIYALVRNESRRAWLQSHMNEKFLWEIPPGVPADLSLYFLQEGDVRHLASKVSCHQDIAGEGVFSLGMLAEFEPVLSRFGAHVYRNLFWECGMVGQMLYLEAEAMGLRATGIGCYFDDAVHEVFGITTRALQSLYHFTVGGPLEDSRITTLPAYFHRDTTT